MSPSTNDRRPALAFQPNPFADWTFRSAWSAVAADVPSINGGAFRTLLYTLRQMRAGMKGTSIVITGEPGTGKTHLLGRLRNHLEQEEQQGSGDTPYIYVRCNASAATLWRHLRFALINDLLKPSVAGMSRLSAMVRNDPRRLERIRILGLRRAIDCLEAGRHTLIATAWLHGEPLGDSDLAALGIAVEKDDEDRGREMEARRIVEAVLGLLAPSPTVLCFDQLEALSTFPGDETGFHAMGQLVSALNDTHEHLLMITCMVSAFEDVFDRIPSGADRDRWLQQKLTLRRIEWQPATELVKARLDCAPALAAERQKRPEQPLWPIDPAALEPLFEDTGVCLPRALIQTAKRLFDELLGAHEPRPRLAPEDFLEQEYARNLAEARRLIPRLGADKTLGDCLPWLLQNSGLQPLGPDVEASRYAQLAYRGAQGDTAVVLCYQPGVAFTNRLKKVKSYWKPKSARLQILRDPAIKPGPVGASLLAELEQQGARQIHPPPEALAALQAIRNLTATAQSGELTLDGSGLGESEVTRWALDNLPPQLEKLKQDLTGPGGDPAFEKLSPLVRERKIVEAEAAALELSMPPEEVGACARRHPMQFGILEGPPLVLFEAVEGSPLESTDA